ncbi:MaoC/PaaZ C-terminal domain-containing protein [Haloarchaeobius amylolyticus]|uniref:MaoC/PaaZ C-terminal domain-containing protein n=1 Tax=Haloarchaeobius amylolyticus TaxID=1198296 RepID=UPI002270C225|nr:MaoC/PaaZ C-terminal domain-containing protein [Haloarchaeobius amylolyticus]
MPIDPVCGMNVEEADAETARFDDRTYYFCSADCRDLFEKDPETFVSEPFPHLTRASGVTVPRVPYGRAKGTVELDITEPGTLAVGDSATFTKELTEADVRKFAEATGDTNALHLSDAFAAETRFGGRIVHGTLVSGLISAALACFPGLSIYLSESLEFKQPARIGETARATCEVLEVLGDDRYRLATRIENAAGEVLVDGTATILLDDLPAFAE